MVCLEKRADGWEQGGKSDYDKKNTIHSAGHFSVGGLANDPYASPGDPIFYLHHGMMDRVWSLWQAQDPNARFYQVGGSKTPFNSESTSFICGLLCLTVLQILPVSKWPSMIRSISVLLVSLLHFVKWLLPLMEIIATCTTDMAIWAVRSPVRVFAVRYRLFFMVSCFLGLSDRDFQE